MRNYTWLLALALVIGAPAEAGVEKAGTTAANFLSVGSGAGILGMGGATLGAGGDLSMINWNVAALGSLNETQYVISHAGLSANSSQEWAAVGGRFRHSATRWSLSGLYQGDGAFEGRDATGVSTGTFNVSSMAFSGHLAQAFGDYVTLGFGAKFVSENLGTVSGWGGTYDAGMQVHTGDFGFGLAAQNIGGRMMYGKAIYPVPTNIGAGLAYQIPASGLRFALDANFPSAYYSDVRAGVEWMYKDRLALRTGYRKEMGGASDDALTGPTFGMGAGLRSMWFDYGYLVGGAASEGQHRIGLSFHPGALNWSGGQDLGMTPNGSGQSPAPMPTVRTNAGASSAAPKAETPKASSGTTSSMPAGTPAPATPKAITPATAAPTASTPAPATPKAIATATAAPTASPKAIMPSAPPSSSAPKAITPTATPSSTLPVTPSSSAPKSTPDIVAPSTAQKAIATGDSRPEATRSAVSAAPSLKIEAPKPTITQAPAAVAPKSEAPKIETPKPTIAQAPAVVAPKTEAPKPTVAQAPAVAAPKTETPKATVAQAPTVSAPIAPPAEAPKTTAPPADAPKVATPSASEPAPVPLAQRPATIKVRKGDTLASIGRTYGLSFAAIMMENNMVSEIIKPGQTLKLPKR